MLIVKTEKGDAPLGYRILTEAEILEDFRTIDLDGSCFISKNEWIVYFVTLLAQDIESLEKEGSNAIMKKILKLSKEFDEYDTDGNGYIDFLEFKDYVSKTMFISED